MADSKKHTSPLVSLVALALLGGGAWFYFGGGLEQQAAKNLHQIEQQVASDTEKQYRIAKKNGTPMDACVQAGMVAAAHLQAKNEAQYKKWKQTEKSDCKLAGLDR